MSAFRILHLSDIHIGKTYTKSEEIAYKIISDIEHHGLCSIKCVLVTGDIFDGQAIVEEILINEAINFFKIIMNQINCVQLEHKLNESDFVFVPGNHDIIRVDEYEKRWKKYNDFLIGFYGSIPDFYNKENYSVVKSYDDARIVFAGFNSCQIEKKSVFDDKCIKSIQNIDSQKINKLGIDKTSLVKLLQDEITNEYNDYGEISMQQITEVSRKIKKFDGYTVVALFHHHFYLFPEVVKEYGDSSLVRNYANLIQQLKYMNVKTVLHGHKHFDLERPLITEDYYQTTDSIIDIFAGGSVGTNRKDKHTFNIIDFYDDKDDIKITQSKFVYNGESLEPIIKKQIPPKNKSDRIIKLIEILKFNNHDAHCKYEAAVEKIFKTYNTCVAIINWTSEALTGFEDVYKFLDDDHRNILFLLYAINYRTLSYKNMMEADPQKFQSYFAILRELFDNCLGSSDIDIDIDNFHKLFKIKNLKLLKKKCDDLIKESTNKHTKQYIAFSMVGIFFTDIYLVLTEYADDFYNESIKYKANIKLEQNKFHQDVPVPRIEIKSDSDRRTVYLELLCNEATAHKIAVLFVKEFDLLINKFEDYFKIIGLKLYYLLPKIEKNNSKVILDNYNFEAYIPTLIPLLIGENIYTSKEVFARELIQNSIDAIAVRESKDGSDFSKTINVEIGKDENNRFYFRIKDCGTGMDRFKIERYFTSIGRSFYSGDEFDELNIDYKPISNFGIGFLSSFMVCKEIDVKTKSYIEGSEGLKLHIPNYEGCFFIEREDNINVGTEIKLYLNEEVEAVKIVDYIEKVIKDIKYDISILYNSKEGKQTQIIHAYSIRKRNKVNNYSFFVPFKENGDVKNINWESEIITNKYINEYEYGLLVTQNNIYGIHDAVLNSGILIRQSLLSNIFGIRLENSYISMCANFPSNWIKVDVSREKATAFTDIIKNCDDKNPENTVQYKIAKSLYNQLISFFTYSKKHDVNNLAIYAQEIIELACSLARKVAFQLKQDLINMEYVTFVKITDDTIEYFIDHKSKKYEGAYCLQSDNITDITDMLKEWGKRNKKLLNKCIESINQLFRREDNIKYTEENRKIYKGDFVYCFFDLIQRYANGLYTNNEFDQYFLWIIHRLDLRMESELIFNFTLCTLLFVYNYSQELQKIYDRELSYIITYMALTRMTISDIERGNNKICVKICDIENLVKQKNN